MGRHDQDPLRSFQMEADEHLFGDLHMHDRLKDKVWHSLQAERQERRGKRWRTIIGAAAAAAVLGITIVFALDHPGTDEGIHGNVLSEQDPETTPDIMAVEQDVVTLPTTLKHGEETGSVESQVAFHSLDEAESWFKESLMLPSFVPEGYELISMSGSSDLEGKPFSITLQYAAGEQQFSLTTFSQNAPILLKGEEVEMGGIQGYWGATDETELYWSIAEQHYRLIGNLSKEEAMNVAASLQDK
ncbi:DUF4367 domain-containing protein [Xylanibacillus composti]|uniref:DUF4367 domain-containing protein n=1 Tax=Xylanibacillus composti TaxID=1572762 RepID=A0A8J4H8C1_9BACL|nr:DUF4367 domain-containing protein [Xylanibacillus composti]MDT9725099.1 DUF4367 domain-containing protein [Xylanibacillus composti]GIQ70914.1 hypothetical protein XYCOK13_37380 [Xylanibacillus composti]